MPPRTHSPHAGRHLQHEGLADGEGCGPLDAKTHDVPAARTTGRHGRTAWAVRRERATSSRSIPRAATSAQSPAHSLELLLLDVLLLREGRLGCEGAAVADEGADELGACHAAGLHVHDGTLREFLRQMRVLRVPVVQAAACTFHDPNRRQSSNAVRGAQPSVRTVGMLANTPVSTSMRSSSSPDSTS